MAALRFDGRVAIVTGAGGGLGREYARLLAERGAKLVVNDYGGDTRGHGASPERAEAAAKEIVDAGGQAVPDAHSVATPEGAAAIARTALAAYGRIDILINNAGTTGGGGSLTELADEDIDITLDTHLRGSISTVRAVWPTMEQQSYGRIVNITSSSIFGIGGSPIYAAAKAGVVGLTKNIALVGASIGIKVNTLMPVAITRMTTQMRPVEFRDWIEKNFPPSLVAPAVVFLAHEDVPVSGEVFSAGGGRIARVMFSQAAGYYDPALDLEKVQANFEQITDMSEAILLENVGVEMAYYAKWIAWTAGPTMTVGLNTVEV